MNGTDLTNGTFDDLKAVLGEAAETITLELLANPDLAGKHNAVKGKEDRPSMHGSSGAKAVSVPLTRDANGHGLKFGGARNQKDAAENGPGVFVSGTKPNSVASRHDGIRDGLQIVTMNGIDLTSSTFEELKSALAGTGDTLTLELTENADLASKHSAVKGWGSPQVAAQQCGQGRAERPNFHLSCQRARWVRHRLRGRAEPRARRKDDARYICGQHQARFGGGGEPADLGGDAADQDQRH